MRRILPIVVLALLTVVGIAWLDPQLTAAQSGPQFCNGGSPSGNFCSFSPAQLGVSALTAPMGGTTALSNIIDTRSAKSATLLASCTTGANTINVQTYAQDGTTADALIVPVSAITATNKVQLYLSTDANPAASEGTVSATGILRLPQRALAFSFDNAGAAGACTARLFLGY